MQKFIHSWFFKFVCLPSIVEQAISFVWHKTIFKEFFWNIAWDWFKYSIGLTDKKETDMFDLLKPHLIAWLVCAFVIWFAFKLGSLEAKNKKEILIGGTEPPLSFSQQPKQIKPFLNRKWLRKFLNLEEKYRYWLQGRHNEGMKLKEENRKHPYTNQYFENLYIKWRKELRDGIKFARGESA